MTLREFFSLPAAQRKVLMLEIAKRATEAQLALMAGEGATVPDQPPSTVVAPIK